MDSGKQPARSSRRVKLNARWLTLYIAAAMLLMAALLTLIMRGSLIVMEEEVTLSILQTLKQTALNLSNDFTVARRVSDLLTSNILIQEALLTDPAEQTMGERIEELKHMREIIENVQTSSNVASMRLFVRDDKMYARERINFFSLSEFHSSELYSSVSGRGEFISMQIAPQLDAAMNSESRSVVSFVRQIRNLNSIGHVIGGLAVDVDSTALMAALDTITFPNDYLVCLMEPDGTVFASNESSSDILSNIDINKFNDEQVITTGDITYIVKKVEPPGWTLLAVLPGSSIRAFTLTKRANMLNLLGFTLAFTAILAVMALVIIRGVSQRVNRLSAVLNESAQENFTTDDSDATGMSVYSKRNAGLFRQLDSSLSRAQNLMRVLYDQMLRQRRIHLQMLQEQINPHFLYNTLDTLQWLVRGGDSDKALMTIQALTRYLRLILNNGRDIVTVADEVRLTQAYLTIQQQRFGQIFETEFNVAPEVTEYLLPKMTLQPLIENAILHGLRRLAGRTGHISIKAALDSSRSGVPVLVIEVLDNGVGIAAEQQAALLNNARDERSGFGLGNVHERIVLYSGGEQYGLSVESELNAYTRVTARIAAKLTHKPLSEAPTGTSI
ncbi:sensor histidine kinase [Clostridia bacterium]|nr:sensor histidine kinase [Clostridia bacterium]